MMGRGALVGVSLLVSPQREGTTISWFDVEGFACSGEISLSTLSTEAASDEEAACVVPVGL